MGCSICEASYKYSLLRPIAGAINFCPNQFVVRSDEDNIRIGIHEVVHALVTEMVLLQ